MLVDDVEAVTVGDDHGDLVDGEVPQGLVDGVEADAALRQAGHKTDFRLDCCRVLRLEKNGIFFNSDIIKFLPIPWRIFYLLSADFSAKRAIRVVWKVVGSNLGAEKLMKSVVNILFFHLGSFFKIQLM